MFHYSHRASAYISKGLYNQGLQLLIQNPEPDIKVFKTIFQALTFDEVGQLVNKKLKLIWFSIL